MSSLLAYGNVWIGTLRMVTLIKMEMWIGPPDLQPPDMQVRARREALSLEPQAYLEG